MVGTGALKLGSTPKLLILMDDPQSILIIQLKRVGDVILTTPIPALLKRRFPKARIGFLVERSGMPLLEGNPSIDQVHPYDKDHVWSSLAPVRSAGYEWVIDFQGSPRSAWIGFLSGARVTAGYRVPFWGHFYRHTVKRPGGPQPVTEGKLSLVASLTDALPPLPPAQIFLSTDERSWARQWCGLSNGMIIGMVPTHRRASRRWSADSFVALAQRFIQKAQAVWLFWGPGEEQDVEAIHRAVPQTRMIPRTSLRQMAALLERCHVVVANDNGPMHLAHAVGAPTVTVYGPTDPRAWNPGGPRHRALQAEDVPCLGCNLNVCPFNHECMTHLSVERVWDAAQKLLSPSRAQVSV
jgi:heptosyltransferase-3